MSLFDAIAGAIANPDQQGNSDQLGFIMSAVQSIAGSHTGDPGNSANIMSAVGSVVQSALQNHQANVGTDGVENLVNQVANGEVSNPVQALFGGQEQQVVDMISQRTGIDASQISGMLPTILPMVLQLLQSGNSNAGGGNSVLNTFLDGNQDGNVDLGDLMSQASRFLGN
jgi:Bacterial protein of unknown function (DUF937)